MGPGIADKILLPLHGRPAFTYAAETFFQLAQHDLWIWVTRDSEQELLLRSHLREFAVSQSAFQPEMLWVRGGAERSDSVAQALQAIPHECTTVTIHDLARPAVALADVHALYDQLVSGASAISMARRVTDTIRRFDTSPVDQEAVGQLINRDQLWAMETPQAFDLDLLRKAYQTKQGAITDDLAAIEQAGKPVRLVAATCPNPKLTHPADIPVMEGILSSRLPRPVFDKSAVEQPVPPIKIGYGYDIHRLGPGRDLILGGVKIPCEVGLEGHSDADVLIHAMADAILGALGLPDIGCFFPNTDPAVAGIDSRQILAKAVQEAQQLGYGIGNIDATLIAERPKLAAFIPAMKSAMAPILSVPASCIGIKATTQEGIGALGKAEGIAAHAIVILIATTGQTF